MLELSSKICSLLHIAGAHYTVTLGPAGGIKHVKKMALTLM